MIDVAEMKLKYKIAELIEQLPKGITLAQIEEILQNEHKINRTTFYRDRCISLKSSTSIASDRLDVYAQLFSVSPEDLKNYKVTTKSLKDRNLK